MVKIISFIHNITTNNNNKNNNGTYTSKSNLPINILLFFALKTCPFLSLPSSTSFTLFLSLFIYTSCLLCHLPISLYCLSFAVLNPTLLAFLLSFLSPPPSVAKF